MLLVISDVIFDVISDVISVVMLLDIISVAQLIFDLLSQSFDPAFHHTLVFHHTLAFLPIFSPIDFRILLLLSDRVLRLDNTFGMHLEVDNTCEMEADTLEEDTFDKVEASFPYPEEDNSAAGVVDVGVAGVEAAADDILSFSDCLSYSFP